MKTWKLGRLAVLCCLIAASPYGLASDGGTTTLTITGNIVEPECEINDNQQIVVNFGEVYDASKTTIAPNSGVLSFTYAENKPPALYAVPVMQTNASLPDGAFNGSATMVFSYQ